MNKGLLVIIKCVHKTCTRFIKISVLNIIIGNVKI